MNEKFITIRIDSEIHKKFKSICAELGILMSKQNQQLIENFVRSQEKNLKILGKK